jgi:dienelactone hydrolase/Tol biopolymer transport system component
MIRVFLSLPLLLLPLFAAAEVQRVERGNLVLEDVPPIPASMVERIEQYQNTRSAAFQDWLPDGGMLIATRFADTSQVHRVRTPGATREQLTFFGERVFAASAMPDGSGFLFLKDIGGSEFFQIFRHDFADGRNTLLTDGSSRYSAPLWNNAGTAFTFTSTERNGRDFDIMLGEAHGERHTVLQADGMWLPFDFSPDDRRLIVARRVSINESHPHLLDLDSGELTELFAGVEPSAFENLRFARDGKGIWFTSNLGSEFRTLRHLDLASGEVREVSADIPWDVRQIDLSRDGRWLAFVTNEDGIFRLHLRDLRRGGREVAQPALPTGVVGGLSFNRDGSRLALVINSPRSPGDVYSIDLGRRPALTRWTHSEAGGLDTSRFADADLIRYPTFDEVEGARRTIPAFVYRPQGEGPFPVVVQIHGGPEAQALPTFSAIRQFWIDELGVAVIAPNVRGSAGYGRTFLDLDNGMLREDSVKDIGALLDWIATQPDLDATRVAVYGGSYGGYMVLASMIHFAERLRAGVDVVGISNFVSFLENTQDYRRDARRVEYGDERDPEMRAFLERISPTARAAEIRAPLLIAQGQNDPRVPASESEQMVATIREHGGTVWYFLALDEGHGFARKRNRDQFEAATALFLEKHLLGR